MSKCLTPLLASLLAGMSAPVAAAPAVPEPERTITVIGEKLSPSEARKQSNNFVRVTTALTEAQYSRRTKPICPRIIGIEPAYAAIVEARVRMAAAEADVPQAQGDCSGNLFILFSEDGNRLMKTLYKAKPSVFNDVPVSWRPQLLAGSQPIRWWHVNDIRNSENGLIGDTMRADGIRERLSRIKSSSLIDSKLAVQLTGSVVVIDVGKSDGYPLTAIADFAAMVSLAQIRGDQNYGNLPSILSLFAKAPEDVDPQMTLTRFDKAYLRSMNGIAINRDRYVQKNQIVGRMAAALAGE